MKRTRLNPMNAFAGSLLMMAILAGTAQALMIPVPLDQLTNEAGAILAGRVTEISSAWTADGYTIVTDVQLRVEESWRGNMQQGDLVSLQVQGGIVGDIGIRVEHQPTFRHGENVVVFLAVDETGVLKLNHAEQSKFIVAGHVVIGYKQQPLPFEGFKSDVLGHLAKGE